MGLKLNGTCQLLVQSDDVNLLGDNIETGIDPSTEVDLEVKAEKSKYVLISCYQNAR
jgi:hypothetical protein